MNADERFELSGLSASICVHLRSNRLAFTSIATCLALFAADLAAAPWLAHMWPPFHQDEPR
jgi:hypothetical protein